MPPMMIVLKVLQLSLLLCATEAAKILFIPVDHPGHVNFFSLSAVALRKMGHDVHVLTMEKYRSKIEKMGLKSIAQISPTGAPGIIDDATMNELVKEMVDSGKGFLSSTAPKVGQRLIKVLQTQWEEILENKEIEDRITKEQFDMAVVDGFPVARCALTLPYRHSLRFVSLSAVWTDSLELRVPSMLSVEPLPVLPFTNEMTFFQRLANFLAYGLIKVVQPLSNAEPDYFIERYAPNRPKISLGELYKKSELFMTNAEIYLMDYPRVSAPHLLNVGSLGGAPPEPLNEDLEKFVSSAEEGTILVSFGSVTHELPQAILDKLMAVFSYFPKNKFVMRLVSEATPPKNVKLMKWLPQNDLLGHKNVKLYIGHGGNNGQMEGLYHGVPMIVFPQFGDQVANAARVVNKGYGMKLSVKHDSVEKIVEVIKEVLENPVYAKKIKRASEIYKAMPKANETVAFWVDHIIRFGSDHIRPPYLDMPLYQFFMLDVVAFILLIVLVVTFSTFKCCKCCCRFCFNKSSKPKTD